MFAFMTLEVLVIFGINFYLINRIRVMDSSKSSEGKSKFSFLYTTENLLILLMLLFYHMIRSVFFGFCFNIAFRFRKQWKRGDFNEDIHPEITTNQIKQEKQAYMAKDNQGKYSPGKVFTLFRQQILLKKQI